VFRLGWWVGVKIAAGAARFKAAGATRRPARAMVRVSVAPIKPPVKQVTGRRRNAFVEQARPDERFAQQIVDTVVGQS
jgi:hypothetical protein